MIGAAALLMACSSEPTEDRASVSQPIATERFWTTFQAGQVDELAPVQRELVKERDVRPTDPDIRLVLGMSYVWGSAEGHLSIPEKLANANRTLEELRAFTELAPEEPRSWAHLGTAMVTIGGATGNAKMRDDGRRMVEEKTMPKERAEAGFALGAAMSQAPPGTPGVAAAIDYFFMAYEDCIGHAIDRDAPSFDGLEARRTSERPRDVCFNQPHWPHAEEGNFLVFGDTLEKAGKRDAARKVWEAAKAVPAFADWKFKSAIDDRLAGKPHEGVGAAPSLCTQCHAK